MLWAVNSTGVLCRWSAGKADRLRTRLSAIGLMNPG